MSVGGLVLGTGTSACFQAVGTIPWRIEQLKIAHSGSASHTQKSRQHQFGTLSGPFALDGFTLANLRST